MVFKNSLNNPCMRAKRVKHDIVQRIVNGVGAKLLNEGTGGGNGGDDYPLSKNYISEQKKQKGWEDRLEDIKKSAFVVFQKEYFRRLFLENKEAVKSDYNGMEDDEIISKLGMTDEIVKDTKTPFKEFVKNVEEKVFPEDEEVVESEEETYDGEDVDTWAE